MYLRKYNVYVCIDTKYYHSFRGAQIAGLNIPYQNTRMGEISLNPTDEAIIKMLQDGRCTPSYIAESHGYSRQNVTNRLNRLVEHGYVTKIHTGLYELSKDPNSAE